MIEAKDKILEDAIRTAITYNYQNRILKRVIGLLCFAIFILIALMGKMVV